MRLLTRVADPVAGELSEWDTWVVAELPSGTVAFLFTDLEGSTRLWQEQTRPMQTALARHDAILRDAVEQGGGVVVKGRGDGIHAAFATPEAALVAAVAAQRALTREPWDGIEPLRVRMGVHVGTAEERDGDYFGPAVNRAARVMDAAHGGQIVASGAVEEVTRGTLPAELVLRDLGVHRLRDLAEADHLYQVVGADLDEDFPAVHSIDTYPTNLPFALTTFVGRDDEITEVTSALEDSRVVTLTGVGGVGKTRLALHVAAEVLPSFRDGAWLCELGPVSDGNAIADVVAATLAIQPRPGRTSLEAVVDGLRHRQVLLVLDNCEHVIGPAAHLVDAILRSCEGVRVLATSREGLGTGGERLILVRSLHVPDDHVAAEDARMSESVRLFVDRAGAARRGFTLSDDNVDAIAQLCGRLDGIPLAIELAAARTRMMSPVEIATRLDERFRLLTGGSRTAVERHQTLRAAVDWSYDLLEPPQQTLLDRLGVFAGGFTLKGAAAVGREMGEDCDDGVIDELGQLVDKSLVLAEEDDEGTTRYRLLETIRQYALAHLDDVGITDAVRRRHAEWLVRYVVEASQRSHGPDEVIWARRLQREVENLRAAIAWATGTAETSLVMALLGRLEIAQWPNSAMLFTLGPWADVARALPGALEDPNAGSVLALRAADHLVHDRIDDAERDAVDAAALVSSPDAYFVPTPWGVLLRTHALSERGTGILSRHTELVDVSRARGDRYQYAQGLCIAAMSLFVDDRPEAAPYAEEAFVVAHEVGAPTVMAFATSAATMIESDRDPARALELAEQSLTYARDTGHGMILMNALNATGRLARGALDPAWAANFRDLIDATFEAGDTRLVLSLLDSYVLSLIVVERYEPAAVLLGLSDPRLPSHTKIAQRRRAQAHDELVAAIGHDRLVALEAEGGTMSVADAVAFARAELDRVINS